MGLQLDLPTVLLLYKTALVAGALSIFHVSRHSCRPQGLRPLSAAYLPISAVMVNDRVFQGLADGSSSLGTWGHGFTYSGHPVAAAVAVETLKIYDEMDLVGMVKKTGPVLQAGIQALADHPLVGEARGVGMIGAFAAREVFVSTMGLVYGVGADVDEESSSLRDRIRADLRQDGRPTYTPLTGLSLMVFFALAAQCMSTLAIVKRETRGWRWPAFLFVYMTGLAWVASLLVYQTGRLLGLDG
jgi:hypothetical protein